MMTTSQDLDFIEINPKSSVQNSIIWLHGLGANGHDFVPIVPELQLPEELGMRFVFPHAPSIPVTINNGYIMPAWYDIVSMNIDQRTDEAGVLHSSNTIMRLIEQEEERGISSEHIFLAGFSQGAVIALTTGLRYPKRLGGVIALSGYLPHTDRVFREASSANQDMPIFLAHGSNDSIVPFFLGEMARDVLKQHRYAVEWHAYAMQHSVCGEEINDIGGWLRKKVQ